MRVNADDAAVVTDMWSAEDVHNAVSNGGGFLFWDKPRNDWTIVLLTDADRDALLKAFPGYKVVTLDEASRELSRR